MPSFDTIKKHQADLVRKMREGSAFVAPMSVPVPSRLTSASDNLPVALTGFTDLGLLSDSGAGFSADVSTSDTTVWQSVEPARTDVTGKTNTLTVTARETNRAVVEAYTMTDLSDVDALAGGAFVFDEAAIPDPKYGRVLVIGVDQTSDGPIYVGRLLARARVTGVDDQEFSAGDEGLAWGLTWTGFQDPGTLSATGAPVVQRWFFEGEGWNALAARAGFPVAS